MANTTADKLALLEATKANLKAALAEKGQTVGDVFSTYPAAVRAIETGVSIETVSVTNNFNISAYTVLYENGVFGPGHIYSSTKSTVLKGAILVFPSMSSSPIASGDCDFIGIKNNYFGFSACTAYKINGNCTFSGGGGGGN